MNCFKQLFYAAFVAAVVCVGFGSTVFAQASDTLIVTPERGTNDACGFNVTVKNSNAAGTAIDEIRLVLTNTDGTQFTDVSGGPVAPNSNWEGGYDGSLAIPIVDSFFAVGGHPIAAGTSLSGFRFAYFNDGTHEYDQPKSIDWTTYNNGTAISTGTLHPICTTFQEFDVIDTATVSPSLDAGNPNFLFTMINRNSPNNYSIGHLQFQLISVTSGFIRPSKVVPPQFWLIDSINSTSVYFHSDVNQIQPSNSAGFYQVELLANTNAKTHSFAWIAGDPQGALIDRDTIFNIAVQATSAKPDADSVGVSTTGGCLYQLNLKNFHVANALAPSPLTRFVISSQTSGVTFSAAPGQPSHWSAGLTSDSIVYSYVPSDVNSFPLQSGVQDSSFSFSVTGPTSSPFTIGWVTYQNQKKISTGSFTASCTIEAPRTDTVTVSPGAANCSFDAHVANLHNSPASNITAVEFSIPSGSGELIAVGSTVGPTLESWNTSSPSTTDIKFTSAGTDLAPQLAGDFTFNLSPQTSGQDVALTWKTFGSDATTISTGTTNINCTQSASLCDTLTEVTLKADSCIHGFTLNSRGSASIPKLVITSQFQNWIILTATAPAGWTADIDASKMFVTFTSTDPEGLVAGGSLQGFVVHFDGTGADTDLVKIVAAITDAAGHTCSPTLEFPCNSTAGDGAVGSDPYASGGDIQNVVLVPNPTTASSNLMLTVATQELLYVSIFDELGSTVRVAANQVYQAGTYSLPLDMSSLANGNYYVRIQTRGGVITKRLIKQ